MRSLAERELLNHRSSLTGLSKCPSKWIFPFTVSATTIPRLIILVTSLKMDYKGYYLPVSHPSVTNSTE